MSNFGVTYLLNINKGHNRLSIEDNIGEEIHIHFGDMRLMLKNSDFKSFAEKCLDYICDVSGASKEVLSRLEPIFLFDLCKKGEIQTLKLFGEEYVSVGKLLCPVKTVFGNWKYRTIKHSHFLKVIKKKAKTTPYDAEQVNYINNDNFLRTLSVFEQCKIDKDICEKYPLFVTEENIIRDGQHRAAALYYLYGPNYKVKIQRMETFGGKSRIKKPLSARIKGMVKAIAKTIIVLSKKLGNRKHFSKNELKKYKKALSKNINNELFSSMANNQALTKKMFFVKADYAIDTYPVIIRKTMVSRDEILKELKKNGLLVYKGHILEGCSFIYGLGKDYLVVDESGAPVAYLQDKVSSYAMSVNSFMPYAPEIQKYLDSFNKIPNTILFVLRLLKCMFDKKNKGFHKKDVEYFEENKQILDDEFFKPNGLIKKVFFGYTDRLLELLRSGSYELLIDDYRKFEY